MDTMFPIPAKRLLAMGILLMLMASFAVACGGDSQQFAAVTPTPDTQPTDTPTVAETEQTKVPDVKPTSVPTTPSTTESPGPTDVVKPPGGEAIELSLIIMKRAPDDTVTVLQEGEVLTANDYYGIFFEPAEDSWVYVLQQDSTKAIDVLFPNPSFSDLTNPVPGDTPVWIPKNVNNWFRLDQNIGAESFFVVASKAQNEELESMIIGHAREELLGPLATFLESGSRGVGGAEKLDKEPKILPDGSTETLDVTLLEGDGDNFVYSLEFQHK